MTSNQNQPELKPRRVFPECSCSYGPCRQCNEVLEARKHTVTVVDTGWLPIETAPEGKLVVCMWLDKDDPTHPERYKFDWKEDGLWLDYFNEHEHYAIAGVAKGNSEDAPYTHWMPLPATLADKMTTNQNQPELLPLPKSIPETPLGIVHQYTADQMREYALANMNRHAESELLECRGAFEQVFSPLHPMHRSSAFPDEYMDTFTQGMWIAFKSAWSRATTAQAKDGLTDDEITALAVEYEIEPSDRLKRSVEFDHPSLIKFARAIEQRTAQATPAGEGVGLPVFGTVQTVQGQTAYVLILDREAKIPTYAKLTDHATATAEIAKRDAEIARLVQAVADHLTVRGEYFAELTALRAQLADAERRGVEWACKRFAHHDGHTYADMVLAEYERQEGDTK